MIDTLFKFYATELRTDRRSLPVFPQNTTKSWRRSLDTHCRPSLLSLLPTRRLSNMTKTKYFAFDAAQPVLSVN